jgi:hypothetical protein
VLRMKEEDQRLIDEARRSREATEELRAEGSADEADEGEEEGPGRESRRLRQRSGVSRRAGPH